MKREKIILLLIALVFVSFQILLVSASCNQNSDCGTNVFFGDRFCTGNSIFQNSTIYTCIDSGSPNSTCSNSTVPIFNLQCLQNQFCSNGVCFNYTCTSNLDCNDNNTNTEDICLNPSTINASCSHLQINCSLDSQCGTSGFIFSTFCGNNNVLQVYTNYTCNNRGTGTSYCSNSDSTQIVQTCLSNQLCEGGVCKTINCTREPDFLCNDNNSHTEDHCINPNTTISYCNHLPIICLNNNECGINSPFGNLFCSSSNIISQNFINYTCNSPGTNLSYCSSINSSIINATCLSNQLCSNGSCLNVPCFTDLNCSDANSHTFDQCINPGTLNALCVHTPINCTSNFDFNCNDNLPRTEDHCLNSNTINSSCYHLNIICFSDSECGTSGFIENNFCSGDNLSILRNYNSSICMDPGFSNSTCRYTISPNVTSICLFNQLCDNAICKDIICTSDFDPRCNDNNIYTQDRCLNPNTVNSLCDHTNITCLSVNDTRCNDNNSYTEDICFNSGTINSSCNHFNITCFNSSDCGNNRWAGNFFCNSNNVFDNYLSYTCNNPGTKTSSCSNSTSPILNTTCASNQLCSSGTCLNVTCFSDLNCSDSNFYTEDKCINPGSPNSFCNYTAITCLNDNDSFCNDNNSSTEDKCINNGTINSVCSNLPIACFNNSMCGSNGIVHPLFCENNNVMNHFLTYTCNNPGTHLSSCSNSTSVFTNKTCLSNQLCSEGDCSDVVCFNDLNCSDNNAYTQDKCINNGTLLSNCTYTPIICLNDNDSHCNDNNVSTEDHCLSPGLINSSCYYTPIRCFNDLNCSDNNFRTEDKCNNHGSTSSTCSNVNIICFNSSECGSDTFVGDKFCNGNNVNWNYLTYTCNSNGTGLSYCTNSSTDLNVQSCNQTQICSNAICMNECFSDGQCNDNEDHTLDICDNPGTLNSNCTYTPIICLNDNDSNCDDHNVNTEDHCINPNTTSSYCVNLSIRCFNDFMCGTNGIIGSNFCGLDNVSIFGNYNTYKCSLPGTANSTCGNLTSPLSIGACSFGQLCDNAICKNIPCLNDLNCSDNNAHTEDHCINPGKLDSSCINLNMTCITDNDSNCNDNDVNTEEHCINPNTTSSYCIGLPIICFNNSGCGNDRFIGDKSCDLTNKNVNRDYITYECSLPGTSNSTCSNSTSVLQVDNCLSNQTCDNAICKDVVCFNNAQCDDSKDHTFDLCNNPRLPSSTCSHLSIMCLSDSDSNCDDSNMYTKDYCTLPGTIESNCTHSSIRCFNPSDCGTNGLIGEDHCNQNNTGVEGNYNSYGCNLPGTVNSTCSNSTSLLLIHPCSSTQLCSNAICKDVFCFNNAQCDDSKDHTFDICDNPGRLDSSCLYMNITCLNDNGCNDNLAHTEDHCLSPGLTNSTCSYLPIRCLNNSECGNNGFVGDKFCNENNVNWNYLTYTCNSNGTAASSCSNSSVSQILQTCSSNQLCDNAICKNIPCLNDLGCSDHNDHTEDHCINPGRLDSSCININMTCITDNDVKCDDHNIHTEDLCINSNTTNSYCNYTNITCINDLECGTDGFFGDKFCNQNNIVKDYRTYKCNNASTTKSYCSNSISMLAIDNCNSRQSCSNATCFDIICFNNSECNDNDAYTYDICTDPALITSNCSYLPIKCLTLNDAKCNDNDIYTLDECKNPNTLNAVCENTPIRCWNNNDCNDNNAHTQDSCDNPGSTSSNCSYLPIICLNDLECGTNTFIGDKSCNGNSVNWNYLSYTCNNNGTASSSCSNSTEYQKLWDCHSDQLCSNGKCMNVTCFNSFQCDDSNSYTEDYCTNNGTLQSSCDHTPIICLNDSDLHCDDNNVSTEDYCSSPGLTNSSCYHLPIECFNDLNCSDNNLGTDDKCLNPGTLNSTCNHETIICNASCSSNVSCGQDGPISNNFCSGNNVVKNYITYTCNNQGTCNGNAFCSNLTTPQLVQNCSLLNQACSNGICKPIPPITNITVSSPLDNILYNQAIIPISVSIRNNVIVDKIQYIDYSDKIPLWNTLCTKCNSYGFTLRKTKSFKEGNHSIKFRTLNGISIEELPYNIDFFVDSIAPRIASFSPTSNGFTNGDNFLIKYNEANLINSSLVIINDHNVKINKSCPSGVQQCLFNYDISNFNNQNINYYFVLTDISGNFVQSRSTRVLVDTTPPAINNPNSLWSQNGKYINFNININESNFDSINYIDNSIKTPRWSMLCSRLNNKYCIKKVYFTTGTHEVTIRVLDKAGNSVDKIITFSIA